MTRITGIRTHDLRFPTSDMLDGSDAMNPDPDYSAAYVILETDGAHEGHGLTFTLGRGTEICVAAIKSLSALVVGLELDWIREDMGRFWRLITGDRSSKSVKLSRASRRVGSSAQRNHPVIFPDFTGAKDALLRAYAVNPAKRQ